MLLNIIKSKTNVLRFCSAILVSVSVFFGLSHFATLDSRQNPHFDIYDEGAHFDYVVNLKKGTIPSWGTFESQETLLVADCLGGKGGSPGSCATKERDPHNFAPGGYSYEAQQPPIGYLPYVFASTESSTPLKTLIEMRQKGIIFWSTLIAFLVGLTILFFQVNFLGSIIIAVSTTFLPTLTHAISTVSNDASVFVAIYVWLLVFIKNYNLATKRSFSYLALTSALLGLVKGFLFLVPFTMLSIMFFSVYRPRLESKIPNTKKISRSKKESTSNGTRYLLLSSVITLATTLSFYVLQTLRSSVPSKVVLDSLLGFSKVSHLSLRTVANSLYYVFSGYYGRVIPDLDMGVIPSILSFFFLFLLGYLSRRDRLNPRSEIDAENDYLSSNQRMSWFLAIATIFSLLSIGLAQPILVYLQGQYNFPAPPRYGLLATPLFILSVALQFTRKKNM